MAITSIQRKLNHGYQRHIAGDTQTAAQTYAEILTSDPTNADAWHLSGLIAFQKKQFANAEKLIRLALKYSPSEIAYQANLAAVLLGLGKSADAEQTCRQILQREPNDSNALKHLGTALRKLERPQEAVEVFRAALRKNPTDADLLCNLGAVLNDTGHVQEALTTLVKARMLKETQAEIHLNLGAVLRQMRQPDDAMKSLDRAIQLAPGLAEAYTNRANLFLETNRPEQAISDYQRALEINPHSIAALSGLGHSLPILGHWEQAMEAVRLASQIAGGTSCSDSAMTSSLRRRIMSNLMYCASLTPGLTRSEVFDMHVHWAAFIESAVTAFEHPPGADPKKRLRIGYVSPDFRRHPTMRFFLPFYETHDRSRFEIYCYSECASGDETTKRVQAAATGWRNTYGVSDQQLAEQIHADQIDVLVDLAGHTAGNRLPSFAFRPAPVQVSFLGYPNTTGMSRMDYLLVDTIRESSDTAAFFTEELVAMPHGACCFQPTGGSLAPAEPPVLKNDFITLGSTHRLEKLSSQCVRLWAAVMERIPEARLLLIRDVLGSSDRLRGRLLQQLREAGIDLQRVDLQWEIPANHLEIYANIDILLDVFPWPSGTTVYEAMWMGVPMPAIANALTCSRASASCLHHVGYPDLIASTDEQYFCILADLAADHERLSDLRRSLRTQMQRTVCNGEQFSRDLESVFQAMWRRHCGMTVEDSGLPLILPAKRTLA